VENENKDNEGEDANGIVHDESIRNVNTGGTVEEEEEIVENDHEANEGNNNGEDNNGRCNLRSNITCDYSHRFTFVSVKAGLTKWGDKARKPGQTVDVFTTEGIHLYAKSNKKTDEKSSKMPLFPYKKRDGRIKARAVADGRSQVRYKEEENLFANGKT
jgi:hypothetical protein